MCFETYLFAQKSELEDMCLKDETSVSVTCIERIFISQNIVYRVMALGHYAVTMILLASN
jgi:hypothetical protein